MAITRDDVRRVAALARLRLEPAEEERLTTDLDHILEAFVLLQRLDTSAVPPMAHVDDFGARLRADEVLQSRRRRAAPGERAGPRRPPLPRAQNHRVVSESSPA